MGTSSRRSDNVSPFWRQSLEAFWFCVKTLPCIAILVYKFLFVEISRGIGALGAYVYGYMVVANAHPAPLVNWLVFPTDDVSKHIV